MQLPDLPEYPVALPPDLSRALLADLSDLIARAERYRAEQLAAVEHQRQAEEKERATGPAAVTIVAVLDDHLALLRWARHYLCSGTLPPNTDDA
jgi:hypothetical protein